MIVICRGGGPIFIGHYKESWTQYTKIHSINFEGGVKGRDLLLTTTSTWRRKKAFSFGGETLLPMGAIKSNPNAASYNSLCNYMHVTLVSLCTHTQVDAPHTCRPADGNTYILYARKREKPGVNWVYNKNLKKYLAPFIILDPRIPRSIRTHFAWPPT